MSTNWERDHWDRLADSLNAAGVDAEVSAGLGGRWLISVRCANGERLEIRDAWWRKNPDIWIGWQAWLDGPDAIASEDLAPTKKRSEVVAWALRHASVDA